jgi:hypothetical protein
MDKYLIKTNSTIDALGDSILESKQINPSDFVLGVIGNSSSKLFTPSYIKDSIIDPILSDKITFPQQVLLPSDGATSLFIESYFTKQHIPVTPFSADWKTFGRRARALRDTRILNESTHLLFFIGSRSDYYEKMAIREAKKKNPKVIYTFNIGTKELEELVTD